MMRGFIGDLIGGLCLFGILIMLQFAPLLFN